MDIVLIILITLLLSGFFSGAEIAIFSLSEAKIFSLEKNGKAGAKTLKKLISNKERLLITILIGNNLVNITSSGVITVMITDRFGDQALGIASGLLTLLILTFGEILPKTIAASKNETLALLFAFPIYLLQIILTPFTFLFEILSRIANKLAGKKEKTAKETEEELTSMAQIAHENGDLEDQEHELIKNVFKLNDTRVKKIMTPRASIFAIEANRRLRTVLKEAKAQHFSRIPIFEEDLDNIIGFLFVKDLVTARPEDLANKRVKDFARGVIFVNENEVLSELYDDFIEERTHIAVVQNQNKTCVGIVTLEDVIEEILGEIDDESDIPEESTLLEGQKEIVKVITNLEREV